MRHKSNDSIEMDHKFDVSVTCVVSVYCYEPCLLLYRWNTVHYDTMGLQRRLVFLTRFSLTNSLMQYQPPAADEEGYNRITHNVVSINVLCALAKYCITSQNPASLTYDEVTINSDKVYSITSSAHTL